ncbi:MAG: FliM/FliN family flagellar motor C-terminal domain-containing protein [Terracidiphilus sp.]
MAPAQTSPPPLASPAPSAGNLAQGGAAGSPAGGGGAVSSQALVPVAQGLEDRNEPEFGPRVLRLPVELDVAVPVRGFRVRHLLALTPGQVIESQWANGSDLPLAVRNVQLAWTEFEVVETKLAVRIARVA